MQRRKSSFALNVIKGAAMIIVLLSALGAFAQTAGTLSVLWDFGTVSSYDGNSRSVTAWCLTRKATFMARLTGAALTVQA